MTTWYMCSGCTITLCRCDRCPGLLLLLQQLVHAGPTRKAGHGTWLAHTQGACCSCSQSACKCQLFMYHWAHVLQQADYTFWNVHCQTKLDIHNVHATYPACCFEEMASHIHMHEFHACTVITSCRLRCYALSNTRSVVVADTALAVSSCIINATNKKQLYLQTA